MVLENVVSDTFGESLRSSAQNAIVVVLGNIGARPVEIDPGLVIVRRIRIAGSGNATYKDVHIALHLLATGAVKPFIGRVLPFPQAAEGHAMMEQRDVDRPRRAVRLVTCTSARDCANWRRVQGDRAAIVDEAGAWSFRHFHARIARFGNAMRGLGLETGDRVALLMPDIREYLEADYGTMAAGLVRVPLDPRLTRPELVALLRHAGARALVTHASFAETLRWAERRGRRARTRRRCRRRRRASTTRRCWQRSSDTPLPDAMAKSLRR